MKKAVSLLITIMLITTLAGCKLPNITYRFDKLKEALSELYDKIYLECGTYTEIEEVEYITQSFSYSGCYHSINDKQKTIYRKLLNVAENMPKGFVSLGKYSETIENDIRIAYRAMLYDSPEIFWMPYEYVIGYQGSGSNHKVLIAFDYNEKGYNSKYTVSKAERNIMRNALNSLVDSITIEFSKYKDVFDREKAINDYICKQAEYDTSEALRHTSYGCLINKRAVCEGYSKAFQLLCKKSGIWCENIVGVSENAQHMWNRVNVYGDWYYVDVTWNDSDTSSNYIFFNINDKQLAFDHTLAPHFSELQNNDIKDGSIFNFINRECTSMVANYYVVQESFVYDNYADDAAKIISDAKKKGLNQVEILLYGEKSKKDFDKDNSAFIGKIQRKIFSIPLDSYTFMRDILTIYW